MQAPFPQMSAGTASLSKRKFDVVIIGAGGSGMRASLQLSLGALQLTDQGDRFSTGSDRFSTLIHPHSKESLDSCH